MNKKFFLHIFSVTSKLFGVFEYIFILCALTKDKVKFLFYFYEI